MTAKEANDLARARIARTKALVEEARQRLLEKDLADTKAMLERQQNPPVKTVNVYPRREEPVVLRPITYNYPPHNRPRTPVAVPSFKPAVIQNAEEKLLRRVELDVPERE